MFIGKFWDGCICQNMAGICIPSLYLGDGGILGLHQPPFCSSNKAAWFKPSSCPGNSFSAIICKGATRYHCCTLPHQNVVVWIHDATVSLVKYIPLAVIALLFLLFLFLPYTLLLLLGQWIQSKSHLCLLSWVKSPKLKAILDTYHAPYKPKYRYWIGLLLLVRCASFLIFAFNASRDDSVNLLVISSATFGIFVMFALSGVVYKSWYLNALEVSFILNLGMLAVATYHVNQSGGSQAAVAYMHLSWHSIPHLCGDHNLPYLHTNQIKSEMHTAW